MKIRRSSIEKSISDWTLNFQDFKLRLQLCYRRIQKSISHSPLTEILEKISKWCRFPLSSFQAQRILEIYKEKQAMIPEVTAFNSPRVSSILPSLKLILMSLSAWFQQEKPELHRIRPIKELSSQHSQLLVLTLVKDFKEFAKIQKSRSLSNLDIPFTLNWLIDQSKSSESIPLEQMEGTIEFTIRHVVFLKQYENSLESVLSFYKSQLLHLKRYLNQQKLTDSLLRQINSNQNGSIVTYNCREALLRNFLESTKFSGKEPIGATGKEEALLRHPCKKCRIGLIHLWKNMSPELNEIVNNFVKENEEGEINFLVDSPSDRLLTFVQARLNSISQKAAGREYIKIQVLMRKYKEIKVFKDFLLNVVTDYTELGKFLGEHKRALVSRYQLFLNVIQGRNIDHSMLDSFFSAEISIRSIKQLSTDDLVHLRKNLGDEETQYLTGMLLKYIDIAAMPAHEQDHKTQKLISLYRLKSMQNLFCKLEIEYKEYNDALGYASDTLTEYNKSLEEMQVYDHRLLEMASSIQKNIHPFQFDGSFIKNFSISHLENKVYSYEAVKALELIFNSYSSMDNVDSMSIQAFLSFCKDFFVSNHVSEDVLKRLFMSQSFSRSYLGEIQFFLLLEIVSQHYFNDVKMSLKAKNIAFLTELGIFDFSYMKKIRGEAIRKNNNRSNTSPVQNKLVSPRLSIDNPDMIIDANLVFMKSLRMKDASAIAGMFSSRFKNTSIKIQRRKSSPWVDRNKSPQVSSAKKETS